ncbi:hypothetical protein BDB00DRAFT_875703 [Zychaea mexicana]|uniref:uncharacterized protein n=1 Tax=Zychaea mexicana TaxID=64656 RepID=UPI0022FE7BE1|nr:uncharacterized protein BDB00DRAFT_875703 [Zychaea mexicana]KAI9490121.1 hypothetical protein BDB00DRAFT_875703 [Zychaea mexicana]
MSNNNLESPQTSTSSDASSVSPPLLMSKSPVTRHSLTRIVKAQIILLASNLTEANYSTICVEIITLIDTYGAVIRRHLIRFLLVDIFKKDANSSGKQTNNTPLLYLLLKDIVITTGSNTNTLGSTVNPSSDDKNHSNNNQQQLELPFVTFAETLCCFCKSDSAPLVVDLEYLYTKLGLDAFQRFALSSLLLLSLSFENQQNQQQHISDQAKALASRDFKHVIDYQQQQLHPNNNTTFDEKVITWCIDSIKKSVTAGFGLFNYQDIQLFAAVLPKYCNDKSICKRIQQQLSIDPNMAE